jgi:hypothetical protein
MLIMIMFLNNFAGHVPEKYADLVHDKISTFSYYKKLIRYLMIS